MRDRDLEQLEATVHEAMTPWIAEFGHRSGGKFYDLGYDPVTYPEQRLDVAYTPPREFPSWVPDSLLLHGLKRALVSHLGTRKKLDEAVEFLQETSANPDSKLSISSDAERRLNRGEALGVLVDHTQENDLKDVAIAIGIMIVAMNDIRYRENAAVFIGLNMSRQGYRGLKKHLWQLREPKRTVASEVTKAAGVIWVMQNSRNRRATIIPER